MVELFDHQKRAIEKLGTGSVLCGGVGSGKSITALEFYKRTYNKAKLFIITTAKKRDTREWESDISLVFDDPPDATIDSWNSIKKYKNVVDSFFMFDEQRVVGSGSWVKNFIKISRNNNWILLTATPGDSWMDYVPVFVANGYYRTRSQFIEEHVVFRRFAKYPIIDHYINEEKLLKIKSDILVEMDFERSREVNKIDIKVDYDRSAFRSIHLDLWNPFTNSPVKNVAEKFYLMRKVVNSHSSRLAEVMRLVDIHSKVIVFYNFDYELEILRRIKELMDVAVSEYNGHKHEPIPKSEKWIYLVHYSSSEGWNCIDSNTVIFYSLNYSYKTSLQAAGRIDRINTPFSHLYYYYLVTDSFIDKAIRRALLNKKSFNEKHFAMEKHEEKQGTRFRGT